MQPPRINDVITMVNGVSTVDVTHADAVSALKKAGNSVSLVGGGGVVAVVVVWWWLCLVGCCVGVV